MCKQFGISVIRGVIVISNFVLLIGSIILIYRTSLLFSQYQSYSAIFSESMQTQPLISMILAILVCIFSVFGFFAICLNALGMTVFFIIFVVLFGIILLAYGAIVIGQTTEMYTEKHYFYNLMDHTQNLTGDPDKMAAIDNIQRDLLCCGFSRAGPEHFFLQDQPLPQSCCKDPLHPCLYDDIWVNDCLFQMELFGLLAHTEIGALMMCLAVQCLIVAAVGYVFAMAIRQYYYY